MNGRTQSELGRDPSRTFSILVEVLSSLAAERSLDTLLQRIMQKACEVLEADRATLFLVDETKQELWSRVAKGTGLDRKTGYHTRTILCMPIKNPEGRILGVLQVLNRREGVFARAEEELLEAFAAAAAIAVQNALLNEELHKRMRTSEILLNVMHAVSSELEIDKLLQSVVAKTSEAMNAERCTLFLVDQETGELWSKVAQSYEYKILINEPIYLEVRDKIPCVDLGFAQVKGKEGSVHIFGVVEPPE